MEDVGQIIRTQKNKLILNKNKIKSVWTLKDGKKLWKKENERQKLNGNYHQLGHIIFKSNTYILGHEKTQVSKTKILMSVKPCSLSHWLAVINNERMDRKKKVWTWFHVKIELWRGENFVGLRDLNL